MQKRAYNSTTRQLVHPVVRSTQTRNKLHSLKPGRSLNQGITGLRDRNKERGLTKLLQPANLAAFTCLLTPTVVVLATHPRPSLRTDLFSFLSHSSCRRAAWLLPSMSLSDGISAYICVVRRHIILQRKTYSLVTACPARASIISPTGSQQWRMEVCLHCFVGSRNQPKRFRFFGASCKDFYFCFWSFKAKASSKPRGPRSSGRRSCTVSFKVQLHWVQDSAFLGAPKA